MAKKECPECGAKMNYLTVKKEGKNKGRKFWGCSDRNCNGFEWADGESTKKTWNKPAKDYRNKETDWEAKDMFHARQTASNGLFDLYCSMIEAGLYQPQDPQEAIDEIVKKVGPLAEKIKNGK